MSLKREEEGGERSEMSHTFIHTHTHIHTGGAHGSFRQRFFRQTGNANALMCASEQSSSALLMGSVIKACSLLYSTSRELSDPRGALTRSSRSLFAVSFPGRFRSTRAPFHFHTKRHCCYRRPVERRCPFTPTLWAHARHHAEHKEASHYFLNRFLFQKNPNF